MDSQRNRLYDATISSTKEASMAKAVELMLAEMEQTKQGRMQSLNRPNVSIVSGMVALFVSIAIFFSCFFLSPFVAEILGIQLSVLRFALVCIFILIMCVLGKRIIIYSILVYQKYAPAELRLSCCFQPCCSEYMKLAIEKYGVVQGVVKGIRRLARCHYPNGGIDNP